MSQAPPLLEARDIHKRFGSVVALRSASLELRAGEVHALVGDNGAGIKKHYGTGEAIITRANVNSAAIRPFLYTK